MISKIVRTAQHGQMIRNLNSLGGQAPIFIKIEGLDREIILGTVGSFPEQWRSKVIGGWLFFDYGFTKTVTFIPDPNHEWQIEYVENQGLMSLQEKEELIAAINQLGLGKSGETPD